jgi:ethanolamine utilization microcompartment shell protein EutS
MKRLRLMFAAGCLLSLFFIPPAAAQTTLSQTIRGSVVDKESKFPLTGVNISLPDLPGGLRGTATDANGKFVITQVPLGRHRIQLRYLGYKEVQLTNIVVDAGREVILNLEMEESAQQLQELVIHATRSGEVANEMAMASARQFSVEETDRYAGSRGEPSRMAANFAGVQGADDSRNDIVIRGNSPSGVLWRLEGITIPNPNHFNIPGTAGGSISIINNRFLGNSDFFTGAFPAEFGNSTAGAFDLKMRNGNASKHEFMAQFGFLGTEAMAEGPLNKAKGSSYLATFRYGNLWLFDKAGIDIGTQAVPFYSDGFIRLNFPQKKGGNISLWGLAGSSTIDILISEQEADDRNIFGSNDRDQYFTSRMMTTGATWSQPLNKNSYFKVTAAYSLSSIKANHDYLFLQRDSTGEPLLQNSRYVIDSIRPLLDYRFADHRISLAPSFNYKLSARAAFKAGALIEYNRFSAYDSVRTVDSNLVNFSAWQQRWDANSGFLQIQPYAQWKYLFSEQLTGTLGISAFYSSINNNSFSPLEPRLGLSYELPKGQRLSFAAGLHSQMQAPYLYYYNPLIGQGVNRPYNLNMGLMKSLHLVSGYQRMLAKDLRLLTEIYFQHLYNIPVEIQPSSFSMVNAGAGFSRLFPLELQNSGLGRNYGLEITLEKFFSKHYYFLITTSLFDAKYQGSDGIWRNTDFNGRYAINALFAREFSVGKNSKLNLGARFSTIGGRWYGPVDEAASRALQEVVFADATRNTLQFNPYRRLDLKVDYKMNRKGLTHTIAVDLVNFLGIQNQLTLTYIPQAPYVQEQFQLGFLPVFFYRIDF